MPNGTRVRIRQVGSPVQALHPSHVQFGRKLTSVPLPQGLPSIEDIIEELLGYTSVLLGHEPSPIQSPYLTLAEVAAAYFGRAKEIEMLILDGERSDPPSIKKTSPYVGLRTGRLRSFMEMAKVMYELGSRRLSQEVLLDKQRVDAGEQR